MRTVSIKHEGSDAPSGWDSLIVDAIKRQDHAVIMHSFFRNTLSRMLGITQSVQEQARSGVMVDNHFYNVTPKKCIQPLWAYALIVVGLARYHALAGQLAHILQSTFGDRYKNGSIEMSADAFVFYMKDWVTTSCLKSIDIRVDVSIVTTCVIYVDERVSPFLDYLGLPIQIVALIRL